MAQSIFEQHEVLDQLFVELKRSYKQGELPSLEQLKQIAPELSFDEYQTLIERFSVYIHEQDLQQFYAQVKQLNQEMPLLPVQSSLQTSILALEQEFMKTMVRFLLNREQEIGKAATQKMQALIQNNEDLQAQVQDLQAQQYELEDKMAQYQASFKRLKDAYDTQSSVMEQLSMSEEALGLLRGALSCKDATSLRQLLSANNTEGSAYQAFTLLIKLLPPVSRKNILKLVDNAIMLAQEKVAASSNEMFDFESDILSDENATGPAPASVAASFAAQQDGSTTSMRAAAQTAAAATAAVADAADEVDAQLFSTEEQYLQSHLNLRNGADLTPEKFKQLHAALAKEQENLDVDEEGESLDLVALMRTKPTVASALSALRKTPTESQMADIETPAPAPVSLPESEPNNTYGEENTEFASSVLPEQEEHHGSAFVAPQVVTSATTRISAMPLPQPVNPESSPAISIARTLSTVDHGTTNIVKLNNAAMEGDYPATQEIDPVGLGAAAAAAAANVGTSTTGATAISRAAEAEAALNSAVSLFAQAANANATTAATANVANVATPHAPQVPNQGTISADLLATLVPASSPKTAIVQSTTATPQPQPQPQPQAQGTATTASVSDATATATAVAHALHEGNGGHASVVSTNILSPAQESQAQALFDGIEKLCEQFFANKESTDITSLDLENVVSEAIEQELFAAPQAPLCRRLVLKMMMVGRENMQSSDCFAKDEDVVASLPSEEQKQFARAVLAWGGTKVYLKKGAVDEATTHSSSVTNVVVTVPPTAPNVPFNVTAVAGAPSANTAISGVSNLTPAVKGSGNSNDSHDSHENKSTLNLNEQFAFAPPRETAVKEGVGADGKRSLTIDLKSLEEQHHRAAAALGADSNDVIVAKVNATSFADAVASSHLQDGATANLDFATPSSLAVENDTTLHPEAVATSSEPPASAEGMASEPDPETEMNLEVINRTSHALPRDEGSLVREMSHNGDDDSVAAFAAASAKIASFVQQSKSDGNSTEEGSAFLAPSQSSELLAQGQATLHEGGDQSQDRATKAEIAAVAKDVLKVAQELEQGVSLESNLFNTSAEVQVLPKSQTSLFGSEEGRSLTGTTVLGLQDSVVGLSEHQSSNQATAPEEQGDSDFDDMISGPSTKDDLDDFITGNIVDPNLESNEVPMSQSLPEQVTDKGKEGKEQKEQIEPSALVKPLTQQNDAARGYPTSKLAVIPVEAHESATKEDEAATLENGAAALAPEPIATTTSVEATAEQLGEQEPVEATAPAPETDETATAIEAAEASGEQVGEQEPVEATAPAPESVDAATSVEATADQGSEAGDLEAAMVASTPVEEATATAPAPESVDATISVEATTEQGSEAGDLEAAIVASTPVEEAIATAPAPESVDVTTSVEATAEQGSEAGDLEAAIVASTPVEEATATAPAPETDKSITAVEATEATGEQLGEQEPVEATAPATDASETTTAVEATEATGEQLGEQEPVEATAPAPETDETTIAIEATEATGEQLGEQEPVAATAPAPDAIETTTAIEATEATAEQLGEQEHVVGADLLQDERYQARLSLNELEREQFVSLTAQLAENFNNQLTYLNNLLQNMKSGAGVATNTEEPDENTVWVSDLDGDYQSLVDELTKQHNLSDKLVAALKEKMQEDLAKEQTTSITAEDFTNYPSLEVIAQNQEHALEAIEAQDALVATESQDISADAEQSTLSSVKLGDSVDSSDITESGASVVTDVSTDADDTLKLEATVESEANEINTEHLDPNAVEGSGEDAGADEIYDDDEALESDDSADSGDNNELDEGDTSTEVASQQQEHKTAFFTFISPDADDGIAATADLDQAELQVDSSSHEEKTHSPMQFSLDSSSENELNTITIDFEHHDEPQDLAGESSTENEDSSVVESSVVEHSAEEETDINVTEGSAEDETQSHEPEELEKIEAPETTGATVNLDATDSANAPANGAEATVVASQPQDSAANALKKAMQEPTENVLSRSSMSSVFNAFRAAAQAPESTMPRNNQNFGNRLNLQDSSVGKTQNNQANKGKSVEGESDPDPEPHPVADVDSVESVVPTEPEPTDSVDFVESEPASPEIYHEPDMSTATAPVGAVDTVESAHSSESLRTDVEPQHLSSGEQDAAVSAFTKADRSALQATQATAQGLGSAYSAPTKATFLFHPPQDVTLANSMHGAFTIQHRQASEHMRALDDSTFNSTNPYGGVSEGQDQDPQPSQQLKPQTATTSQESGSGAGAVKPES